MKKTPRRTGGDTQGPPLTRLESFVLSRVDGQLSINDLVTLTGLAAPQVDQILSRLTQRGAIEMAEAPSVPQLDELLADEPIARPEDVVEEVPGELPPPPSSWIAEDLPPPAQPSPAVLMPMADDAEPAAELIPVEDPPELIPLEDVPDDEDDGPVDSQLELPPEEDWDAAEADAAADSLDNLPEDPEQAAEGEESEKHPSLVPAEGDVTDPAETNPHDVQNYRKLYETKYHKLTPDERVKAAKFVDGADLFALCFDADPHVVKAILDNDRASLEHARLIAAHHRNPVGLAALCDRVSILKDARVQRMLLRNIQLTEALARKILMPKRLLEIYKASIDRDVTDRTRGTAKGLFKGKFSRSTPEEKFEIIWNTEGRVLPHLLGQTIDMKTAALFCARNFTSVVLIQAFSRFPATPPSVLAHILRQPLVKRHAHIRNMVLQHPNVPSEAKRKV